MEQYRFAEKAVKYFRKALRVVKIPDFYVALGFALRQAANLEEAEAACRAGLSLVVDEPDAIVEADLSNELGQILKARADLVGAERYTRRGLQIYEQFYPPKHPAIAFLLDNLGTILQDQGDLLAAQSYLERAMEINVKAYGPDHPSVALNANDLGQVLLASSPRRKSHY